MSVGKICHEGPTVVFQKSGATVFDADKNAVCLFERELGGLYVAKLKLKAPGGAGFARDLQQIGFVGARHKPTT